jgi:hypothetical protein
LPTKLPKGSEDRLNSVVGQKIVFVKRCGASFLVQKNTGCWVGEKGVPVLEGTGQLLNDWGVEHSHRFPSQNIMP